MIDQRLWITAGLFSLPAVLGLLALVLLPVLAVFVLALTDWQFGASTAAFVGLHNFYAMFSDKTFRTSLINTAVYVAVVVPGVTVLGFLVATAIESQESLRSLYRSIHFLPVMATLASMAIAWEALLHPTIGPINAALSSIGLGRPNWLADSRLVVPTLCVIGIWQHLGYAMVLFIAGLKSIPNELYEAAALDGVDTPIDRALRVTLPMLGPVTMFILIVVALKAFEVFDIVRVLTRGGPGNASEMLLHTLYVESFEFFRTGYGAALTVVFLLVVVTLTLLQARILDRRVHYT
ncbi:carbohydrate ABC transporter permease [Roseibium sp. M-1]